MTQISATMASSSGSGGAHGDVEANIASPLPEQAAYPSPLMGWLTVAILFLLYILSLTDRNIMALMVGPIKKDLGLSDLQISLLQGPAFAILFCLCAIPLGMALDRFSRRVVLYLSVTVWSIAAASCGLAGSFAALAMARAGVGAGESGFGTGSYSVVGDSFPPHKVSLAMSVFIMGGVMGAGIVFLFGGPIVAAAMKAGPAVWPVFGLLQPWQQVFIMTGAPGIALAFLVFAFREPPRRRAISAGAGYGEAWAFMREYKPLYLATFVGFGLAYAATIGFQLWTPVYLARVHGWEPGRIGPVIGLAQIGAAAMIPLHGWTVDRLYRRGKRDAHLFWCLLTVLASAPFGIAAFLVSSPWTTVACYWCFMALILSTSSMGPATVQVVTPQYLRGRVSALYVLASGLIAMAGGPAFIGLVTDKLLGDEMKVGLSLVISVFCVLLPAALLFAFGRASMRRAHEAIA
ncbi:MFS transporter [Sphingobium sp. SA916]|uniref:MFS transporter n=1 Tax=Sphingobium sp. SA916 TaxID=1851207 RepID=UPI000CAC66B9|nr:MFS transporter [Sphingobium sp. SA916]PNQ01409.1 MFS transporter [Sphingobium sp. SA916]